LKPQVNKEIKVRTVLKLFSFFCVSLGLQREPRIAAVTSVEQAAQPRVAWIHFAPGPSGRSFHFTCRAAALGGFCPICARGFETVFEWFFPIYRRSSKRVFIWPISSKSIRKQLQKIRKEYGPLDRFDITARAYGHCDYPCYDVQVIMDTIGTPKPAVDPPDLNDFLAVKGVDEIEETLRWKSNLEEISRNEG
jgi:hypothetical protein